MCLSCTLTLSLHTTLLLSLSLTPMSSDIIPTPQTSRAAQRSTPHLSILVHNGVWNVQPRSLIKLILGPQVCVQVLNDAITFQWKVVYASHGGGGGGGARTLAVLAVRGSSSSGREREREH